MTLLPPRHRALKILFEDEIKEIVEAWRTGELRTEEEWLDGERARKRARYMANADLIEDAR